MRSDCSLLISSCDKYSDLWAPCLALYERFWSDCPFEKFLITEQIKPNVHARVNVLRLGVGHPWSRLLRQALACIESTYVIMMLDDFFLKRAVCTADVVDALKFIEKGHLMVRLTPRPAPARSSRDEYSEIAPQEAYRVSTQAAIWRRDVLETLLRDEESPWEFEISGTKRAQLAFQSGFYGSKTHIIPYFHHVVERGKWFPHEAARFRRMNIGCDFTKRQTMSYGAYFVRCLRKALSIVYAQLKR